jgi:hypothetical protein
VWTGAAPAPAVSGSLMLRGRGKRLSIALEGRLDLPASRSVGTASVSTAQTLAVLAPCVHFDPLAFCATLVAGSLRASSENVRFPRTDASFQAALGPRAMVEIPIAGDVGIGVHVDALYTLTPQAVALDDVVVYDLPRLSGGAGIFAVWRFF